MPFAPRLRVHVDVVPGRANHSTSRTGIDDESDERRALPRQRLINVAGDLAVRSVRRSSRASSRSPAGERLGTPTARSHGVAAADHRRGASSSAATSVPGVGRDDSSRWTGSRHAPRRCTTTSRAPEPSIHWATTWTPAAGRPAGPPRAGGLREPLGEASNRMRDRVRPERADPDRGSASTGQPPLREADRSAAAPAPAITTPRTASSAVRARRRERRRARFARRPRCATDGRPIGRPGERTGLADQRITERKVEVHGPRSASARAERLDDGTRGDRSPGAAGCVVGHAGIDEPARRVAVQVGLVDRLRRATPCSSAGRSAVAGDERHARSGRLRRSRRCSCDGRGAAAREHDRRYAAREAEAEGDERGAALVVVHVHRDAGLGGERDRKGVDRDPGHTTASVTPARIHSSTSVARRLPRS